MLGRASKRRYCLNNMSNLKDLAGGGRGPQAAPAADDKSRDAEMREVVLKFEELYAELAPQAEEEKPARADDPFLDFPGEPPPAQAPAVERPLKARETPRVDPVLARKPVVEAAGAASKKSVGPGERLDIEEAISVLRAAEASGKAAAERAAREARDEADPEAPQPQPQPLANSAAPVPATRAPARAPARRVAKTAVAQADSPAQSGTFWSLLLIAASLALIIGTGVGYLMGRGDDAIAVAKIQSSPEGGARLRPDYELRKR